MKKFLIKSICLVLVTVTTFSLCGCISNLIGPKDEIIKYIEYGEIGNFTVLIDPENFNESDTSTPYFVKGLSEIGKQQTTIVMPERLNGHPYYTQYPTIITHLFAMDPSYTYNYATFESEMLEKLYIVKESYYWHAPTTSRNGIFYNYNIVLSNCPRIDKLIRTLSERVIINNEGKCGNNIRYENYRNYVDYLSVNSRTFKIDEDGNKIPIVLDYIRIANLQFLYNYDGALDKGYFWIDDIDNGEKVEVMPDTPEREGYTFGGWYTEEECVNKFDFNTVFNKPVLEVGETYPDDYVTYLYAKWVQNEG